MRYEITLMVGLKVYSSYFSNIIPLVDDMISLTEKDMFVVESRILHINKERQVILNGKIV